MGVAPRERLTRRGIIEPGTTWALSRRAARRYFLLNPDQSRQLATELPDIWTVGNHCLASLRDANPGGVVLIGRRLDALRDISTFWPTWVGSLL